MRSIKFGPAKFSINFAVRGPTPVKLVTGAKSGKSICGRTILYTAF